MENSNALEEVISPDEPVVESVEKPKKVRKPRKVKSKDGAEGIALKDLIPADEKSTVPAASYEQPTCQEDENWFEKIKPEFIVVNRAYAESLEKKYQKPIGELDVSKLDDKYKLVLLGGLIDLAKRRGFSSVDYQVIHSTPEFASVKCVIDWLPLDPGCPKITFSSLADASRANCDDFMSHFLVAAAENRAFCKCVRKFLGINIAGKDEINPKMKLNVDNDFCMPATDPRNMLADKLKSLNRPFEKFRDWWVEKSQDESAKEWGSEKDVPVESVWEILTALKIIADQAKAK